jgi:hypothetical protein
MLPQQVAEEDVHVVGKKNQLQTENVITEEIMGNRHKMAGMEATAEMEEANTARQVVMAETAEVSMEVVNMKETNTQIVSTATRATATIMTMDQEDKEMEIAAMEAPLAIMVKAETTAKTVNMAVILMWKIGITTQKIIQMKMLTMIIMIITPTVMIQI